MGPASRATLAQFGSVHNLRDRLSEPALRTTHAGSFVDNAKGCNSTIINPLAYRKEGRCGIPDGPIRHHDPCRFCHFLKSQ